MRISDWSSDVCSSDLAAGGLVYSHRYLQPVDASTVASFGDTVRDFVAPAATPDDQRSHVVHDADDHQRFTLNAAGAAGWTVGENRLDAAGNVIEVRAYERFLPDASVATLDSAASPDITVMEIAGKLAELGYDDTDPESLAGVQRTYLAYDASNRQRFTIDPSGAVTDHVHDAAGALTVTRRFAARPVLTGHGEAAVADAVDRDDPANRNTRPVPEPQA